MTDSEENCVTTTLIKTKYGDGVEVGGDENDFFYLGGDAVVTGGGGCDVFYVGPWWFQGFPYHGTTTIKDFTRGEDVIDVSGLGFKHFDQLDISMDGTTAVIDMTVFDGGVLRLENISASDLGVSDFKFNVDAPVQETIASGSGRTGILTGDLDLVDYVVTGNAGENVIQTGAGYDVLNGGAGADKLTGGRGTDTLTGGADADSFVFALHHGNDVITDFAPGVDNINLNAFGDELRRFSEIKLIPDGDDTVIDLRVFEGGGTIRLKGVAPGTLTKDDFELLGSELVLTDMNETVLGGDADDVIDMGGGDDIVDGGGGVNDVIGGSGSDKFQARGDHGTTKIGDFTRGEDLIDVSRLGIGEFGQLTITAEGTTAVIDLTEFDGGVFRLDNVAASSLDASDFKFLVESVEYIKVTHSSNPTYLVLSEDDEKRQIIEGGAGDDYMNAQGNDDELLGLAGDDTLIGGTGDDKLTGGAGADTFGFGPSHGADTITDFTSGTDLIDLARLTGIANFDSLNISTDGNDTVINITAHGGGTIRLDGVTSSTLDAEDFKFYSAEEEAAAAAAAEIAKVGQHIVLGSNDGQISYIDMDDTYEAGDTQGQYIEGGGGDDYVHARGGDDTIIGHEGDDTLVGGTGDDTLTGGAGADTFVFETGHDTDTITDFNPGEDVIGLTALTGITNFDSLNISTDGNDTVVDVTAHGGGTIRLEGVASSALKAEHFEFYTPPPPEELEIDLLWPPLGEFEFDVI